MSEAEEDRLAELRGRATTEPVAALLGLQLVTLEPGYAKVTLALRPEHLAFHGRVFGGIVLAVADAAFGYGSNSVAYPSVASQLNLHFLGAPAPGDVLVGECRVVKSGRRVGVSELTVSTGAGKPIARGTGSTVPVG